jgi:hypothetical protein
VKTVHEYAEYLVSPWKNSQTQAQTALSPAAENIVDVDLCIVASATFSHQVNLSLTYKKDILSEEEFCHTLFLVLGVPLPQHCRWCLGSE